MILTEEVEVRISTSNIRHYSKIFENLHVGDVVNVKTEFLKPTCSKLIKVSCDYCGKIFFMKYGIYNKCVNNGIIKKCACKDCISIKRAESNKLVYGEEYIINIKEKREKMKKTILEKYGVENISKSEKIKEKKKETCRKNFGCDYPMQNKEVREKSKETLMREYGVDHISKVKKIHEQAIVKCRNTLYKNSSAPASKAQRYICTLFNGILNYPVFKYSLDILIDNNIYIEYDGSGHDMCIRENQISRKDFIKKEEERFHFLKKSGFKMIKFINQSDKLPDDFTLILLKNMCLEFLEFSNEDFIIVNLDSGEIITKNN